MLSYSSSKIEEYCYEIGIKECNKYITQLVTETIDISIDEEEFNNSVVKEVDNSYKEFNVIYLQSILKEVSNSVIEKINIDKNSYIISEIPISLVFDNPLIASIGPNVPISYKFSSDVLIDMNYNVSSFGLNNALIEILLNFEFEVLLYIPLKAKTEKVKIDIPIYSSLVEGEVPSITFGEHDIF